MRAAATALWLALAGLPAAAQLTTEQKLADFEALASLYSKYYAPYEWKRDALRFDLLDGKAWLERVRATTNDLDFYEVCAAYVAGLQDAHSTFSLPSQFSASLDFSADLYEGKVLVDRINRGRLPAADYPFQIGDEVVSVDGKPVAEVLDARERFVYAGNPRSRRRLAAARLTARMQMWEPRAHEIGETAEVEIRRADGSSETYRMPWRKSGEPLTAAGPVPSPKALARLAARQADFPAPLAELGRDQAPETADVLGVGAPAPVWRVPPGFEQRLGRSASDFFYSGVIQAEELRIGFLRIANFLPRSTAQALRQFEGEIAWMEEHTDGLVVDVMRNSGGDACYNEELQRRLIPYRFRGMGRELRATRAWINQFSNALDAARRQGSEEWVIRLLEARLKDVQTAYGELRGRTGPLAICAPEGLERDPTQVVYSKPLMVLTDEFSASAAEAFAAVLQDARRAPLFGMRTMGAGGSVSSFAAGVYSESSASVTVSLHNRLAPVVTGEYPAAPYVENIGVRPEMECDYMTRDNLLSGGRGFVEAFTGAMVEQIRKTR